MEAGGEEGAEEGQAGRTPEEAVVGEVEGEVVEVVEAAVGMVGREEGRAA